MQVRGYVQGALLSPGVFVNSLARALSVPGCSCSCTAGGMSQALLVRSCQRAAVGALNVQMDVSRLLRSNFRENGPPNDSLVQPCAACTLGQRDAQRRAKRAA